jgi:hypothetical protein
MEDATTTTTTTTKPDDNDNNNNSSNVVDDGSTKAGIVVKGELHAIDVTTNNTTAVTKTISLGEDQRTGATTTTTTTVETINEEHEQEEKQDQNEETTTTTTLQNKDDDTDIPSTIEKEGQQENVHESTATSSSVAAVPAAADILHGPTQNTTTGTTNINDDTTVTVQIIPSADKDDKFFDDIKIEDEVEDTSNTNVDQTTTLTVLPSFMDDATEEAGEGQEEKAKNISNFVVDVLESVKSQEPTALEDDIQEEHGKARTGSSGVANDALTDKKTDYVATEETAATVQQKQQSNSESVLAQLSSLPIDSLHSIASYLTPTEWISFGQCNKGTNRFCKEIFNRVRMHGYRCATEIITAWVRYFVFVCLFVCHIAFLFFTHIFMSAFRLLFFHCCSEIGSTC